MCKKDEKALLRQEVKRLKALLTEEELQRKSALVWAQVEKNLQFMQAKSVLLYWSMPGEVYTHDFIRSIYKKKSIILPVIDGDMLRLALFEGEQSLRKNDVMNIYEPQGIDYHSPEKIELAIIPGIAFDRKNNRLGRGKGYYDRLLPQLKSYNIGVCFNFQLFDAIPAEEHDIPMDAVITGYRDCSYFET